MAWAATEISAAEQAAFNAGYPVLVGRNLLHDGVVPQWRLSGSWASGSDATASGFPTTRLYDGYGHLATKPNAADTDWYLLFDFSANPITFDCFMIAGHNIGELGIDQLDLEIDNANTFATAVRQYRYNVEGATLTNERATAWRLYDNSTNKWSRFSGVSYLRLKFNMSSTPVTWQLSEFWLGRRYQLYHQPLVPYQVGSMHTEISSMVADGGARASYIKWAGQRVLQAKYNTGSTAELQTYTDWYASLDYGRYPFLWADSGIGTVAVPGLNTASDHDGDAGNGIIMTLDNPDFSMPKVGPYETQIEINASEQGGLFRFDEDSGDY